MAKALFGSVVAPHELRVAEENAALRARVRRLEQQLVLLQEERDAAIARELLSMTHESAAPALASTSA
jgi:cell division protein FtsB